MGAPSRIGEEDPLIPGIRPLVELEVTRWRHGRLKLAGYAFVTRLVVKEPGRSLQRRAGDQ